MNIRTDLAMELREAMVNRGDTSDGIVDNEEKQGALSCSDIQILSAEAAAKMGRPIGRYITVEFGRIWQRDYEDFKAAVDYISSKLELLLQQALGSQPLDGALIVGLGNRSITADAVGPEVVQNVIVTHHLRSEGGQDMLQTLGLRDVAGIAPGVLGQTGVESADIVRGIVDKIKPSVVIIIDALASRQLARLATTVQLTDTGISPGSGVGNRRTAISRDELGVPVVSIGIPTVVDVATLVSDVAESMGNADLSKEEIAQYLKSQDLGFFVTPKEADAIIAEAGKIIGYAINRALHGDMSYEEMARF